MKRTQGLTSLILFGQLILHSSPPLALGHEVKEAQVSQAADNEQVSEREVWQKTKRDLEEDIEKLDQRIGYYAEQAEKTSQRAKDRIQEEVRELQRLREEAKQKLFDLKETTRGTYGEIKSDIEAILNKLESKIDEMEKRWKNK